MKFVRDIKGNTRNNRVNDRDEGNRKRTGITRLPDRIIITKLNYHARTMKMEKGRAPRKVTSEMLT